MSWCDKLASTPNVGFKLDYHYASGAAIIDAFSPLLDKLVDGDQALFSLAAPMPLAAAFTTNEGIQVLADQGKINVAFQHQIRAKAVSAGPPVMEMLSQPALFSKLLPQVFERLIEATMLLPGLKTRQVRRVGVVATTVAALGDLPPGITRFITYVGRPWKGIQDDTFHFQFIAETAKSAAGTDRCYHVIAKPEGPDQLITISLDWQRIFASGRPLDVGVLEEIAAAAEKDSVRYFEDLAEGYRFDEDSIRGTD